MHSIGLKKLLKLIKPLRNCMKKIVLIIILSVTTILMALAAFAHKKKSAVGLSVPSSDLNVHGDWSGILDVGMQLTLIFHVEQGVDGLLSAKVDCPEQRISGIAVDTIMLQDKLLKFAMENIKGSYEGSLNEEATEIIGTFTQSGISFPLVLKRGVLTTEIPKRPQEPKPPYPYLEEEVNYENIAAGITLAGTLTLPNTQGPFPVALLITGSGPHDRNEALLGHKPFLVLADHLTRCGIAVLRVDDRGVGKSTGIFGTATDADFASDVRAGVGYLKTRKEINAQQIGLIGHSCGGIIAPMVAAQSTDIAFIILMAGPGENGEKVVLEQAALIQCAEGVPQEVIELENKLRQQMFAIVKKESDFDIAAKQLREVGTKYLATLSHTQKKIAEQNLSEVTCEANLDSIVKTINTAWWRHFLTFEPTSVLKQIKVPVLALFGELDLQVSPRQNLPVVAGALQEAGNSDYTMVELPRHNHLLQVCQTGSIREYGKIEETISPLALHTMSEWIMKRTIQKVEKALGAH